MKRLILVLTVVLATGLAVTACSIQISSASVTNAVLAKGAKSDTKEAIDPTNTFATDQAEIHLVANIANAPSGTKLKVIWIAVDVGVAAAANYKIREDEIEVDGTRAVDFMITSPTDGWPVGKYKAELYLNDKLDKTLEFTVA